MKDISNTL